MPRPVVHVIAHTHWDREWYLPLGALRARLVPMIDGLLSQLDADPRLASFLLDGQTILLEDYLTIRPEQRERVAELVRAGRLATGPWYVLADEQIPSGEALLRNLLIGAGHQQALDAPDRGVLYSPDAFGHPAVLPTLAAEAGLTDAVLWRGLGEDATGGRDLAWWEGPDGRRVLVYHLPPDGYEIGSNLLVPESRLGAAWAAVKARLLPRAATRHVALFVGADHHAPDPDLGGLPSRLWEVDPEVEFRSSSLAAYFRAARGDLDDLPLLAGDLRWSYGYTWTLQGVHGTRAPLKRRSSLIELGLARLAEPLAALFPARGEGAILRHAWREVVQCHFHDAIGGCAADEVAQAMTTRLTDAAAAADEVAQAALARAAGPDPDRAREGHRTRPALFLWNPVARPRGGVVTAEVSFFRRDILVGPPGERRPRSGSGGGPFLLAVPRPDGTLAHVSPQLLDAVPALERLDAPRQYPDLDLVDRVRIAFPLSDRLPPLTGRLLSVVPGDPDPLETFAFAEGQLLWNGRVELGVDTDGTAVMRTPGAGSTVATGLLALESEADAGDCYTFQPVKGDRPSRGRRVGKVRVSAEGPYLAGLQWEVKLAAGIGARVAAGKVMARLQAEAVGDSPVLRLTIALDNQARDHRLRLRFPTGLKGADCLAGAQYGSVRRGPVQLGGVRYPSETPVRTAPAQRWVAAARGGQGLAVFAPGFFEYEWTARGDLLITLLRSVGELSRGDLSARPGHAGWPTATPEAQCLGQDVLELGLAPVTEADLAEPERLEQWWEDRFLPPVSTFYRCHADAASSAPALAPVELIGDGLVLTALKPADDGIGYILRCANARNEAVAGRWRWTRPPERVTRVRADEQPLGELMLEGTELEFEVGARELWSFRVEGG